MRYDGRDFGGADKLAPASSSQRWATGGDEPDLGGSIPESGYVCEGWEVNQIDGVMEMEECNKNENKGRLGLMDLIIIGLSIFLFALVIKWFVFMD